MILATASTASRYAALHPAFAHCLAWLASFDPATPDGNHDIGQGCEARVMSYVTEPAEQRKWESHRRFIDIQWVVNGSERMEVAPLDAVTGATPYDAASDVRFYEGATTPVASVVVHANEFTIFFPDDAHRPNICVTSPAPVRKIVVKVPIAD